MCVLMQVLIKSCNKTSSFSFFSIFRQKIFLQLTSTILQYGQLNRSAVERPVMWTPGPCFIKMYT